MLAIPPGLCLVSSFRLRWSTLSSKYGFHVPGCLKSSPICFRIACPDPSQSGFFPNRLLTQSGLTLPPLVHCTWPTSMLLYTSAQKVPYCRAPEHGVMVHRARRESHSSHKMGAVAVANTGVPTCQPQVPTTYQPESGSIPACQCSAFLDPYPSPQAHWR